MNVYRSFFLLLVGLLQVRSFHAQFSGLAFEWVKNDCFMDSACQYIIAIKMHVMA